MSSVRRAAVQFDVRHVSISVPRAGLPAAQVNDDREGERESNSSFYMMLYRQTLSYSISDKISMFRIYYLAKYVG